MSTPSLEVIALRNGVHNNDDGTSSANEPPISLSVAPAR